MSRVPVRRTTAVGLLTSLVVSCPSAQSSESPRLQPACRAEAGQGVEL